MNGQIILVLVKINKFEGEKEEFFSIHWGEMVPSAPSFPPLLMGVCSHLLFKIYVRFYKDFFIHPKEINILVTGTQKPDNNNKKKHLNGRPKNGSLC
jgi:hypothetical protein